MARYGHKGWIKLWREELENPLYFEEPFTKWQAWIDLCMLADSNGIIKTSLKALKMRWSWGSVGKVTRYLRTLSEMGNVTVNGTPNKGTLIRINADISAKSKKPNGIINGTVNGTDSGIEEVYKEDRSAKPTPKSASTPIEEKNNWLSEDDFDD